ncbi:MAG: carboxypeptidase M32 [Thaumarchaeota archaeon]|nr:carboxypeptidase M32 [Nitrososphaerota archaeon]
MAKNPVVKDILKKYSQVWAIYHSQAVMGWDRETHMPEAGARSRGMASGQLSMMVQKATLELDGLVGKAEKAGDLDDMEKGVVRVLRRSIDFFTKIPPELVDELERVTAEATVVWRGARKKNEYKLFQPHLQKIIELNRKVAEKLGYKGHPYNALLNLYEEDFTVRDADKVFSRLVPGTRKTLAKVTAAGRYPSKHPLESAKYETNAMERVNEGAIKMLHMPTDRFRMDVSTHPFTVGIAPDDVRITTRYEGIDFKSTLFSTIHESGHAIYNLGFGKDLAYTPVADGASLGVHESQSRFWENVVGRSREFAKLASPLLKKNLKFLARYDSNDIYYYFNTVRRSLIRVDADELTYNLHIALRYEIEKKIIAGQVEASELPELWNDTFEEYLGIRPPNDTKGVLQDVHWSGGSMGYFPTYSLGNVILGMIWHTLGDGEKIRDSVAEGALMQLKAWLNAKIHRWGAVYPPKDLQEKVFQESYNPERLLKYQEVKYLG